MDLRVLRVWWRVASIIRMSCNGCRALRKGCGERCSIRPCLHWINNPQSQANATLFLAKFYGRAGLVRLLDAVAPEHLRPAVFHSLLYDACGRMADPISGTMGFLSSGSWDRCQAAVDDVLRGGPLAEPSPSEPTADPPRDDGSLLRACDIRHVPSGARKRPAESRTRELTAARSCEMPDTSEEVPAPPGEGDGDGGEVDVRLTLGFQPMPRPRDAGRPVKKIRLDLNEPFDDCHVYDRTGASVRFLTRRGAQ